MANAYSSIPGFKDVEIVSIRKGSVIVDHKVVMEIEIKSDVSIQDGYQDAVTILKEQLEVFVQNTTTCNQSNPDTFCLSNSTNIKEIAPPSETELCQERVPANFSKFYFPYFIRGVNLSCASHCTKGVPDAINCNHGECRLLTTGPQCFCQDQHIYWYSGERCDSRVNKGAVYGGFASALAVLVIIIITVTVLLQASNKKKHQGSERSSTEEQRWYEDPDDLDDNEGITVRNTGALIWEDQEGNSYSSTKEKFRPSLEKVDTNAQITIQRPKISSNLSDV